MNGVWEIEKNKFEKNKFEIKKYGVVFICITEIKSFCKLLTIIRRTSSCGTMVSHLGIIPMMQET